MDIEIASILITALLAIAGYWITKRNELDLARRKERLELVNSMINNFYGPLHIANKSGAMSLKALREKLGTEDIFSADQSPPESTIKEWRVWVVNVFIPLNQIREDIIINNAHLIREQEMPDCLLRFIAHSLSYKAMVAKWEQGDISEYLPIHKVPKELDDYVAKSYRELKEVQTKLIGEI